MEGGGAEVSRASALANRGMLVTQKVREFGRIAGLQVEDWCGAGG